MSKKTSSDREKHDEKDLEEEEDERDEDEEEEEDEEDEEHGDHAAPATASRRGRARRDDDGHDDHDDDGDDEEDVDDPYWWAPHAVMSGLVLIGVLGFFGAFNKLAGSFAGVATRNGSATTSTTTPTPNPHVPNAAPNAGTPPAQREEFGAKHLLVQYKGSMRASPTITRTEEEAKARATEAMKKAKSGTKFEDVVKEYSDEPGAGARGGDLGKFKKGSMVPEFQNAVEKLKVGEISDLVKTPFGYHVILRTQ